MGGFHFLDLAVIIVIGLLILGPKTLQSISRNAGKTMGHAKTMKDKVMAELPMEEIAEVRQNIPRIPLNSNQAIQMLLMEKMQRGQETMEETKEVTKEATEE
jgi:Sec-independent protein translocase protein TatA